MDDAIEALRAAMILRAKAQIMRDYLNNVFAPRAAEGKDGSISCYSDLHDYVDANYYGGAFEAAVVEALARALNLPQDDSPENDNFGEVINQFFTPMQDAVDEWIRGDGIDNVLAHVHDGNIDEHCIRALAAGLPVTAYGAPMEEAFA